MIGVRLFFLYNFNTDILVKFSSILLYMNGGGITISVEYGRYMWVSHTYWNITYYERKLRASTKIYDKSFSTLVAYWDLKDNVLLLETVSMRYF